MIGGSSKGKIIFDMDGVITGEERYWDCAALVVWELLFSQRFLGLPAPAASFSFKTDLAPGEIAFVRKTVFQDDRVISFFKQRAVNSNWDLAFLTFSFQLVMMLCSLNEKSIIGEVRLLREGTFGLRHLSSFSQILSSGGEKQGCWAPDFGAVLGNWSGEAQGLKELTDCLSSLLPAVFRKIATDIFFPFSPLWKEIRELFQEWYLGEATKIKNKDNDEQIPFGKKGLINCEEPLLPVEGIKQVLTELTALGWVLGIATGRPRNELYTPLERMGLWSFFAPESVVTYSEVEKAERHLGDGWSGLLGKPHPFSFLKAYWENSYDDRELAQNTPFPKPGSCWIVGDSKADLLAARRMEAPFIGVLTGSAGPDNRALFEKEGAKAVLADITFLPSFFNGLGRQ